MFKFKLSLLTITLLLLVGSILLKCLRASRSTYTLHPRPLDLSGAAAAQNAGSELQYSGITPPKFTCIPLKQGYEFKLYLQPEQSNSRFPF